MGRREITAIEMNNKEDFASFNIREKLKKSMRPYDYYETIKDLDFENLTLSDTLLLQDFGIYNNELNDDEFMLRLRFPAGRITNNELELVSSICKKYQLDIILTARAGMQIHGLEASNILEVFDLLNNLKINTWQSFGDNIRNIVTDVFDGIGKYNIIEAYPYIKQMQDYILKNPKYVGVLPRRLSIAVSGSYANGGSFFASDVYFALAKKDEIYGFNVYLGGKNTELAQDANIFLQKEELLGFFKVLINTFNTYGLRLDRERTRLFHLLEDIGMDKFKELMQNEYEKQFNQKGQILLSKAVFQDYEELKNGKYSFCYHSQFARIKYQELENISLFAKENLLEIRLGTDQQLYLFNLKNKEETFKNFNENRTIVACAGSEYCPYAYWNIKDEINFLPLDKIKEHKILVGFSGCLKGCAKHEHSDIGIVGLKSNYYGSREKTARVYLGALYTHGKQTAKKIFNAVPINDLEEILNIIIDEFEHSIYDDFEAFSEYVLRKYTNSFLNIWFLAKFDTKKLCYLDLENERDLLNKYFENENFINYMDNNLDPAIAFLSKKLWMKKESIEDKILNKTYIMQA